MVEVSDYSIEPLTREEMYPKNVPEFEYGWISPVGDTYNTGREGHVKSADMLCKEMGIETSNAERYLEEHSWLKIAETITYNENKERVKTALIYNCVITKKQAEKVIDLGLEHIEHMGFLLKHSQQFW